MTGMFYCTVCPYKGELISVGDAKCISVNKCHPEIAIVGLVVDDWLPGVSGTAGHEKCWIQVVSVGYTIGT